MDKEDIKKAYFYFIPCFFNTKTHEIYGCNSIYDILLRACIHIHNIAGLFCDFIGIDYNKDYPIKIKNDNEDKK